MHVLIYLLPVQNIKLHIDYALSESQIVGQQKSEWYIIQLFGLITFFYCTCKCFRNLLNLLSTCCMENVNPQVGKICD